MKKFFKYLVWLDFLLKFKIIKFFKKPYIILVVGKEKGLIRRKLISLLDAKWYKVKKKIKPYNTWFWVLLDALDLPSGYENIFKWILIVVYSWVKFIRYLFSYYDILILEGGIDERWEASKFVLALGMDVVFFTGVPNQFIDDNKKFNILLEEYKRLIWYINKKSDNTFVKEWGYDDLINLFKDKESFWIFVEDNTLKDLMKITSRRFILKSA